ncbi:MAG: hypothetical protein E3K37_05835 [Candidatus Kuenenia sp.]|nr:hypothetical protein [Candidatus Kuenenia hertensis]
MSRGVAQGEVFYGNEDYHKFLEYLKKTSEKFQLEIFAFVLMGNHYHLFLRTREANLSRAMQWLQTSYSIYFNRKYGRSGHLFQGRYKSILVGEESYWKGLSFYIHLNPVRAGIVKELDDYKWSSYHDYVKAKKIYHWISCDVILKEFGNDEKKSRVEYRKLIREQAGQEKKILDEVKCGLILGSEEFIGWVQKEFINRFSARDAELPQKRLVGDNGIIEKVLDEVAKYFEVEQSQLLLRKRRVPQKDRDVCMYILKEHSGLDNKRIGEVFGVSLSAVTKAALRISEQMKSERRFKQQMEQILNSIFKV